MPRSPITTHVLDTARGRPAAGIGVTLEAQANGGFKELARGKTDTDGRIGDLLPEGKLSPGVYRLTFDILNYQREQHGKSFYPSVSITFDITEPEQHYHVPLLLSPYGYSTYRGS
jgi:5-hydroxyisourate hydrolase